MILNNQFVTIHTEQKWKRYTFAFGQNDQKKFFISIYFL